MLKKSHIFLYFIMLYFGGLDSAEHVLGFFHKSWKHFLLSPDLRVLGVCRLIQLTKPAEKPASLLCC